MMVVASDVLYIGFILPTLFSLTLIGEGIYKIFKRDNGYITFILGTLFLIGILIGYMYVFLY